jgi:hypothetical protein
VYIFSSATSAPDNNEVIRKIEESREILAEQINRAKLEIIDEMKKAFLDAMYRNGIESAYRAKEKMNDWSKFPIEVRKDDKSIANSFRDEALNDSQNALTALKQSENGRGELNPNEISLDQVTLLAYAVNIRLYVLNQVYQVFRELEPIIQEDINTNSNYVEEALKNLSRKIENNFISSSRDAYDQLGGRPQPAHFHVEVIPKSEGGGKTKEFVPEVPNWEIFLERRKRELNFENGAELLMPIVQKWRSWKPLLPKIYLDPDPNITKKEKKYITT